MDHTDIQCSNCLLVEDYRGEVANLSKQVANLHNLLGNPQPPTFYFSSTPVPGCRSGLVEVSLPCWFSIADWPVLGSVPSPKGSPTSLENRADLDPTNRPWKLKKDRKSVV